MSKLQLQCAPWDKIYLATVFPSAIKVYDHVIIKTDLGLDLASVIDKIEDGTPNSEITDLAEVLRLANSEDLSANKSAQGDKTEALEYCRAVAMASGLNLKPVDIRWSFDNSRLTIAFISESRVDFRALVKDLSRYFNRGVRMQQIGVRDETRLCGDSGRCGKKLCCQTHLRKFNSVTGEMAESQGLSARGSDRISGACGRLMCCLAYEVEGYKYLAGKLPALGSKVTVEGHKGTVIHHHLLKETFTAKFKGEGGERDYVMEIEANKHKSV
ncbi:hypothetical protein COT94_03360 [Candidatus Falkowbacteria bacterium CG10_big_fil_rev_8_21_14_0_10_37_14]|uniref:PSP1 C-terminal domain-containing protein n=1 Tax=Candidatus Falkowbacteria bacterium CG10_big_fil_rev_8_21_14_0_10_37_14 TaxID=1974561 RepID=A0A2M6WSS3_9BACT|nr:hypothetical protein [Candidatus Falkowbacteria bacterium]PIT95857.1 MAG: hypothetical protein COT94_03360 [Candidatus Falkowbacteria bacterium CG10_big_fil_rev_8_21_14_0_10_37_14]